MNKVNIFDLLAVKATREVFSKGVKYGFFVGVILTTIIATGLFFLLRENKAVATSKAPVTTAAAIATARATAPKAVARPSVEQLAQERLVEMKEALYELQTQGANVSTRWQFTEAHKRAVALSGALQGNPELYYRYTQWINYFDNQARAIWN